jgi:hypothetical protein
MKRQWTLYIVIIALLLGISIQGQVFSKPDDAQKRASDLAADYQVLAGIVAPFSMEAGEIIIEARLPVDAVDRQSLKSCLDSLPSIADTAIVSNRFHDTRWLYITCSSDADNVCESALDMLTAIAPLSLDTVQLFLNTRWETGDLYSTAEKKDLIQSLFASIDARTIASMTDERMVSISGFSSCLSSRAGAGADGMNITGSLCTDATGQGSSLWLGTPVLTVEY